MTKAERKAFNRTMAAAMRAAGFKPTGEAWEQAKAGTLPGFTFPPVTITDEAEGLSVAAEVTVTDETDTDEAEVVPVKVTTARKAKAKGKAAELYPEDLPTVAQGFFAPSYYDYEYQTTRGYYDLQIKDGNGEDMGRPISWTEYPTQGGGGLLAPCVGAVKRAGWAGIVVDLAAPDCTRDDCNRCTPGEFRDPFTHEITYSDAADHSCRDCYVCLLNAAKQPHGVRVTNPVRWLVSLAKVRGEVDTREWLARGGIYAEAAGELTLAALDGSLF